MELSLTLINDNNLLRLDLYILGPNYLKKKTSRFVEVITEDEVQEIVEKTKVSNFEEEKKKRVTLKNEKKDIWMAARLFAGRFCESSTIRLVSSLSISSPMSVPSSSTLFISPRFTGSARLISGLSALFAST